MPHPAVPIKDVLLKSWTMDFPLHLPFGSLDEVTFHLTMIHIHGSLVCYDKVNNNNNNHKKKKKKKKKKLYQTLLKSAQYTFV